MGWWYDEIVPRITNRACSTPATNEFRRRIVRGLRGDVVEIGFGSGLNLPFLPDTVTHVRAVEPSPAARRLAAGRVAAAPVPVELAGLDGQALPFADASADSVLSTWSLCTIPDVATALHEAHRVLRPGGRFHFLEHGLSPVPGVARWQHRLNGMQQWVFAGCHLNRPIDELVRSAGFGIVSLETDEMPGPAMLRPWAYLYLGVAEKR
jgi:SAM-dependent methyltransferase